MAFQKLNFKPGLNRDQTNYSNEGGWYACDKIRFRSGKPQKIGGWLKYSTSALIGICRQMFGWITSYNDNFLALGTNAKVYIEAGTILYDITPIRATFSSPATNNCFATTNGSAVITATIAAHGANAGDYVTFTGANAVGGVAANTINTIHLITNVTTNTFTFSVATTATSTVAAGGGTSIFANFQIHVGYEASAFGYGWGTDGWGVNGWGIGSNQPIAVNQTDWWFDNFDNDLVMNIRNGAIYYWTRGSGTSPVSALNTPAILLSALAGASSVPELAMQVLNSQNDKHLIAFGATPYYASGPVPQFDPMLIRWASQDEPANWRPLSSNSAGFIRATNGSKIVRAMRTRQEILVWTDTALYSLQYLGTTDVFSLQELGANTSIIGPRAVATANNLTFWMGQDKFYVYSGRVDTLPCTLRDHVFLNLNYDQIDQIICGTNEGYHEVWWFYPTANSNTINAYVIYNYFEQIWYYGTMDRTAWLDSPLRQYPQAIGSHYILNHEQGTNADTLPMSAYITSSDFDIEDGEHFMLVKRIIPDINFGGSTAEAPTVAITLTPHNYPGASYEIVAPKSVVETSSNVYTEQVFIRVRARQMGFKIESDALNTQWQLGTPRLDARADGKR